MTTSPGGEAHPSYLALDRLALGDRDPAVVTHVRGCPACRAHLDAATTPVPVPEAIHALDAPPLWRRLLAGGAGRPLGLVALASAAAAIALAHGLGGPGPVAPPASGDYVGAKGVAAVAVWVKRGDEVKLWDGVAAVAPGDRLQLELEPDGHRWFAVVAGPDAVRLEAGPLAADAPYLLPRSFLVDEAPGEEHLAVILAAAPVPDDRLAAAVRGEVPGARAIRLVLPKSGGKR